MSASSPQPQISTPPSPPTAIPTANPPPPPPIIQALSYSPLRKTQPIPWSHEETLNLIKAYQEKWYSLKRGQLKASQWEEVAVTVAARCGLDEPSKSGTQCRHKIEKLRKRYRAEKQKLPPSLNLNHFTNHPWIYFSLMDQLERGPLPLSAVPPPTTTTNNNHYLPDDTDDDADVDIDVGFANFSKFRGDSSNFRDGILRTGRNLGDFGNGFRRGSDFNGGNLRDLKKRKNYYEEEEEEDEMIEEDEGEEDDVEDRESNLMGALAAQMRNFAERFLRMEGKKMELMNETERLRIEMENKRMEMIFVSQQKTVELISKAFNGGSSTSQKKMKMTSDL